MNPSFTLEWFCSKFSNQQHQMGKIYILINTWNSGWIFKFICKELQTAHLDRLKYALQL